MRSLVVEDDFTSRRVLQAVLTAYGACDVAVNGEEALLAHRKAVASGEPYDLICLDIMMPEMDGQETLTCIRQAEDDAGTSRARRARILMVTALGDPRNVIKAFYELADGYLVKPVSRKDLEDRLREMELIS